MARARSMADHSAHRRAARCLRQAGRPLAPRSAEPGDFPEDLPDAINYARRSGRRSDHMARTVTQLEWIWLYEQAEATWLLRIEPPTTAPSKASATNRPLIIAFSRYWNG